MSGKDPEDPQEGSSKSRFDRRIAVLGLVVAAVGSIVVPLALAYMHRDDGSSERQVAGGADEALAAGHCAVLTTVPSGPTPQPGQEQRSSDDFSLDNLPSGTRVLRWKVIGDNAGSVSFDVLQNVPLGIDRVVYTAVHDGTETPHNNLDPLYIANPQNASQPFEVQVSACP